MVLFRHIIGKIADVNMNNFGFNTNLFYLINEILSWFLRMGLNLNGILSRYLTLMSHFYIRKLTNVIHIQNQN